MDLFEEFQALISALEADGLEYAVIGALAVAVWGAPRATTDIDLLVCDSSVGAIEHVAERCGFKLAAGPITFRDGTRLRRRTKVAHGHHLTLDLLLVDDRLASAWASRERLSSESGELWVVSRQALIEMKIAANRPQDIFDVERLVDVDR